MNTHLRLPFVLTFAVAQFALFSSALPGAEPAFRRVLPTLVHSRGADGTRIETSTWLANLGAAAGSFQFEFLPAAGTSSPPVQSRVLGPGETLRWDNALQELFGLSEGDGALIVRGDQPFELRGVTANVTNPLGASGTSVNSAELLTAGASAHSLWLANRADPNQGFRTDITAVVTAPGTAVTISLYDPSGVLRGIEVVTSEVPAIWRASAARLLADPEIPIGRVKFAVTAGEATGFLSVSGSTAGSMAGDGLVAQPERVAAATPEGADLLLNGVATSTDLRIFNPSETEQELTIDALGFPGGPARIRRTVGPNGLLEISAVLSADGFGFPADATGALRLRSPLPVLAAGRGLPAAVPYEAGFATPARPVTFVGLNDSANQPGVRSRIALLAGATGARGTLRLRNIRGAEIAASPILLAANEWQRKAILAWFPDQEFPADARVDIELENGSAHGYAEIVDNFTQGRVVVAAALRPVDPRPAEPPAASRLAFVPLPPSIAPGAPFTATIRALRPDNSVDTRFTGSVELRVASGPGEIPGSSMKAAVEGVAAFPDLRFTAPGRYTLTALAAGLESAVAEPFEVTAPAPPASPSVIRLGTFAGQNGYTAQGNLQIERAAGGGETMKLSSNFRVSSGSGSVSIWLARSAGPLNAGSSLRVATLRGFSGEFTLPIPAPGSTGFTHVIVYCDPFRINFGAAPLRNP